MRQPILARVLPDVRILALIAGLLVPGLGTATSHVAYAGPAAQAEPILAVGSGAWVVGTGGVGLDVRSAPLTSTSLVGALADGTPVQVLEGPIAAGGLSWYRVSAPGLATSGWTDGAYLAPSPPAPPPLAVGTLAQVRGTQGSGLDVRSAPLLASAVIGGLPAGTVVQVLEGPVPGDSLDWYRVAAPDLASSGWADGQFLVPMPAPTPAPVAPPPVTAPSAAGPAPAALPPPAGGPPAAAPAAPPDPPTPTPTPPGPPVLAVGSSAIVVGTGGRGLVVRDNPGTSSPQIGSLPEGTRVEILAGPAPVGGQNWYQVSVPNLPAQGWVISTALSPQR